MKRLLFGLLCGLTAGCDLVSPQATPAPAPTSAPVVVNRPIMEPAATAEPVNPTNSEVNVRDREIGAKTPLDQNENSTDLNITADIRKRIVATEMSINAHNVKVITQDGRVTLRGPVNSAEEKQSVEAIAIAVAGTDRVDSHLEVAKE